MASGKIYSVQARRFGGWLACGGTDAKASYRVVAITPSWDEARLMAAVQCVDPATLREIRRLAAGAPVPAEPVVHG